MAPAQSDHILRCVGIKQDSEGSECVFRNQKHVVHFYGISAGCSAWLTAKSIGLFSNRRIIVVFAFIGSVASACALLES